MTQNDKSKRWFTFSVNDMLKSKYVAVSYDSSFLVGLHHEQVPELPEAL